jgi:hypothetical protein
MAVAMKNAVLWNVRRMALVRTPEDGILDYLSDSGTHFC